MVTIDRSFIGSSARSSANSSTKYASVIILKKTDIAAIGVISGAITELIAGTIFWLHNKSALQLNHYYDALHENEKVLLAINLTNTLSSEERESMCKEIIRTQIYKQKIDK